MEVQTNLLAVFYYFFGLTVKRGPTPGKDVMWSVK